MRCSASTPSYQVPAIVGRLEKWGDKWSQAYCSCGRAHAIGYLQGVLNSLGRN
jgi:mannonate dehydratase